MILLRLRQQSGSLIPGTAVHALINLTAVPAELLFPTGRNDLTGKKALLYLASAVICVIVCASEERKRLHVIRRKNSPERDLFRLLRTVMRMP